MADLSGSIASGGTAQVAAVADANRRSLFIQNSSDTDAWYAFGATAVTDSPSIYLAAGDTHFWPGEFREFISKAISIIGATTAKKYTMFDTKG